MQTHRTEGVILQALKFKDYDQILTVYTPNMDLVKFIVKGALRPKYNQGALTAPLSHVEFVYRQGKSDLLISEEISLLNQHLALRQSIDKLEAACDLLQALNVSQMAHAPAPDLYKLFVSYLDKLAVHADPWTLATSFRLKILSHEGRLGLSQSCTVCQNVLQAIHLYDGECYCALHAPVQSIEFEAEERELLFALAFSRTHSQLAPLRPSPAVRHKVKLLFQALIQ